MVHIKSKRLFLGLISSLLLITACSPLHPTDQASATQPAPTDFPALEGYEHAIILQLSDWHLTEPHWEQAIREMISAFEEQNPDIKVQLIPVSYAEKEKEANEHDQCCTGFAILGLGGLVRRLRAAHPQQPHSDGHG